MTATSVERATEPDDAALAEVDPLAPRFGQALTATGLVAGIALSEPLVVGAVAAVLASSVLSGWRVDLWAVLWRVVGVRLLDPSGETELAAPHRFAKVIGATGTVVATGLLYAGLPLAGYAVAGAVAAAAGLAAATGICLGCRFYRQVSFARRLDLV